MNNFNSNNVNQSGKKEKKGGILGFLNGGASSAGVTPGVIGGSAQASSSGLFALLSGKIASVLVATIVIGGAAGLYISRNPQDGANADEVAMRASAQEAESYITALQRSEAANNGKSSLGMFNEKNKGAISFDIDHSLNGQNAGGAHDDAIEYDADGVMAGVVTPDVIASDTAESAEGSSVPRMQGSSSMGSSRDGARSMSMGNNANAMLSSAAAKRSASNKFNSAPKMKKSAGKVLAMSKASRAGSVGTMRAGARKARGAYAQAHAIGAMMSRASAGSINYDAARSIADAAWEGTTADGEATETLSGSGLDSGAGMTVSPIGGSGSVSGGSSNTDFNPSPSYEVNAAVSDTPWEGTLNTIQTLFGIAMGLIALAAVFAEIKPWGYIVTAVLAGVAAILSAAAVALSIIIMTKYKQSGLGGLWLAVCGVGMLGCIAAAAGGVGAATSATTGLLATLANGLTALCTILGVVGGLGVGLVGSLGNKAINSDKAQEYCQKHKDADGCHSTQTQNNTTSYLPYELSDSPVVKSNIV